MSKGICDRVAIVGMGCTKFGEHWGKSVDDLLIEAAHEAVASANLTIDDIDAFWLGTMGSGSSGLTLSRPLKLDYKPVSRLENFCATGSDAFRNACYAVASGAFDIGMAIGGEKLKDSGFSGLIPAPLPHAGTGLTWSVPAEFDLICRSYTARYNVSTDQLRGALSRIAAKNHANGARNPRAHFQREVSVAEIEASPKVAGMLGIMDCSGVSDGSAAAVIVRAEDAYKYTDKPVFVKGLSMVAGPGAGAMTQDYDFTSNPEAVAAAKDAYAQAGVIDPMREVGMVELHDCFTPTEMILIEDMGFAERGTAWREVLAGRYDLDGEVAINPDGGLKSFGHPIGASGLRMIFECWLQLRKEAPAERTVMSIAEGRKKLAVTNNLGGAVGNCVAFTSVLGAELG